MSFRGRSGIFLLLKVKKEFAGSAWNGVLLRLPADQIFCKGNQQCLLLS